MPTDDVNERLAENLGHVLAYTSNELIVLDRMEEFFNPKPAKLAETEEEASEIEKELSRVSAALGGPPRLIALEEDAPPPIFDTYPSEAISEILSTYHSSRRSVCKTHVFYIAFPFVKKFPEWSNPPQSVEQAEELSRLLERRFWEEAEVSFIRLASFWDRVGQLLDFAFFNIRQYERDGFPSVVQRVRQNLVPMYDDLAESPAWSALWAFSKSEKPDGLVWLLRRRNLLVHSLHLRPLAASVREDPIFESAYNHLERAVRDKLKPGEPLTELRNLHSHLRSAAKLFRDAIDLCKLAAGILGERRRT